MWLCLTSTGPSEALVDTIGETGGPDDDRLVTAGFDGSPELRRNRRLSVAVGTTGTGDVDVW
jgi:hypothetical protein